MRVRYAACEGDMQGGAVWEGGGGGKALERHRSRFCAIFQRAVDKSRLRGTRQNRASHDYSRKAEITLSQ